MQEAFQKGFEDAFGKTGSVILPEKEIDQLVNAEGAAVCKAVLIYCAELPFVEHIEVAGVNAAVPLHNKLD